MPAAASLCGQLEALHAQAASCPSSLQPATPASDAPQVKEPKAGSEAGKGPEDSEADGGNGSSSGSMQPGGIAWDAVLSAVLALLPQARPQQRQELASHLSAACGLPHDSGGSSTVGGIVTSVTATALAGVVAALKGELQLRFGSPAWAPTAAITGGAAAPMIEAGGQAHDVASSDSSPVVNRAAVRQLVEGLLRQHLDLAVQQHQKRQV